MQVNIVLLTVTDTRTIKTDKSGAILVKKIKEQNHKLVERKLVKDNKDLIKKILSEWIQQDNIDVIITTGGTGLTGRDITPEAIKQLEPLLCNRGHVLLLLMVSIYLLYQVHREALLMLGIKS